MNKSRKNNKTKQNNKTKKKMGLNYKIKKTKSSKSYSPTINKRLVTLKTLDRQELNVCNIKKAFAYDEPLKLMTNNNCYNYDSQVVKKLLLKNLSANKHIDPNLIIPPKQILANCWFNTMFVSFFVSDKGRKFFHFLRQLMIEGRQIDGKHFPNQLNDTFALLNYAIDACLTGNKYAYKLDTNSIIKKLYQIIPNSYKEKYTAIVNVDEASNPILYYIGIINYLRNNSISLILIRNITPNWKNELNQIEQIQIQKEDNNSYPHIVVFEIYDEEASKIKDKPLLFSYKNAVYKLDSIIVRDISKQHFCTMITCEKEEYGYDGMSYHRLEKMLWKKNINDPSFAWTFKGSQDYDKTYLKWNFMKCYQMLMYYRIK